MTSHGISHTHPVGSRPGTASVGGVELVSWAEAHGQPVAYSSSLPPPPSQQGFFPPHAQPSPRPSPRFPRTSATFGMISRPATASLDA